MPSQRRTSRGGPSGSGRGARPGSSTRPGDRSTRPRTAANRGPGASQAADTGTQTAVRPAARRSTRRPRFTGRAAVLVLVLAVLTVSYASSLRAYLQQRAHIGELKSQIAEREANINDLEREKQRWDDPAYVKAQARARFGYLMPGEQGFEVIGEDGKPLEAQATLNDPADVIKTVPKAWWTAAWESMELAGNPPKPGEEPADLIDGTSESTQ
ncbi:septum formation initiator family protein [Nocardioides KLBMP 9356]|uniref:Septum formation initiator family protein n=1 Tax=Nocardioides potassii TaxID=2911371 RepID=A0ABS9H5K9_9ACTN|nr:septum formation initiator family protein [Nocardioides potassii]MCF6376541.1 septum formation initiator family protein [Nocardioides potassii]